MRPSKIVIELDLEAEAFKDNAGETFCGAMHMIADRVWTNVRDMSAPDSLAECVGLQPHVYLRGWVVGQVRIVNKR